MKKITRADSFHEIYSHSTWIFEKKIFFAIFMWHHLSVEKSLQTQKRANYPKTKEFFLIFKFCLKNHFTNFDCFLFLSFDLLKEGENVSKLEKADILELTVRHLNRLKKQQRLAASPVVEADRFRAGFTQAANEVSRVLASTPNVDVGLGKRIMSHLGHRINDLDKVQPLSINVGQTIYSPASSPTLDSPYAMPLTPSSSRSSNSTSPQPNDYTTRYTNIQQGLLKKIDIDDASVWQPWK